MAATVLLAVAATTACTSAEDAPATSGPDSASTTSEDNGSSVAPEDEASPPRLEDLDVGAKPKLAYVDDGVIVTPGGAHVESPLAYTGLLPSANGVTLIHGRTKGSRHDSIYQVLDTSGGSLRLLSDAGFNPEISADGRFVAWHGAESAEGHAKVAGWDVERRTPLANSVTFPFKPTCCDNPLLLHAIDNRGRVYATGGGVAWLASLTSGAEVQRIEGLRRHYIHRVAGDGLILANNGPSAVVGRLRSGVFVTSQTRIGIADGSFSADSGSLAYVDRFGSLKVRDLTSGDVQTMPAPAGGRFGSAAWEDSTDVLLETAVGESGRRTAWVRCSVDNLRCEIALPPGRRYLFPH